MNNHPKKLYHRLKYRLLGGDERTSRTKRNILEMFIIRGLSQATGLLIVPLTLRYLNTTKYGIWLTLSSIIMWFNFFDIGLGNGLRNKLAESLARDDTKLARTYISTTYAFLTLISIGLLLIYLLLMPFLNWSRILNTPPELSQEINIVAFITFVAFCLRFVFGTISIILLAHQEPAINSLIDFFINITTLIFIWILTRIHQSSLIAFSVVLSLASIGVPFLASLWFFTHRFKDLAPSYRSVDLTYGKGLINLGLRFFILQVSYVLLFSTSNILISQLFSPGDVVPYNIAYKYYNLLAVAFSILLAPFWSAYTEAYTKNDYTWIKGTMRRLQQAWGCLLLVTILFTIFANDFYRIWVGKNVYVPIEISLAIAFYILVTSWSSMYSSFINGTGKIQLQVYVSIIISVINIPLAIFLAKNFHLGIVGVILAPSISLFLTSFLWPIQVKKILTNTGNGVWVK